MPASLNTIIQEYLNNTDFLEEGKHITDIRDKSLPNLRRIILDFISKKSNLNTFRE